MVVQFLMSYVQSSMFFLFVLDHKGKKLTWVDPSETPEWCEDMPYKKYVRAVIDMSLKYMSMLTAKPAQGYPWQ